MAVPAKERGRCAAFAHERGNFGRADSTITTAARRSFVQPGGARTTEDFGAGALYLFG